MGAVVRGVGELIDEDGAVPVLAVVGGGVAGRGSDAGTELAGVARVVLVRKP
ncbi:MAG TPA: hypothetical protein VE441_03070 [Mycobacterium sp.]|nr:hypothetical protein [Mycobacterium sp.]